MIGLLVTILVAALAYLILVALTGSTIVGVVAAVLILLAGIPSGGFGIGGRMGRGRIGRRGHGHGAV
jgi:O-antigen ligase